MTEATVLDTSFESLTNGWADTTIGLANSRISTPPAVATIARRVTTILTEVLTGSRPMSQLVQWLTDSQYIELARWLARNRYLQVSAVQARIRNPAPEQSVLQISWRTSAGQLTGVVELRVGEQVQCRKIQILTN